MEKIENKQIVGTIENICLLRKLFIRRSTSSSPLHFGQIAIMRMIEQNENCTQSFIAGRLNVTPASVATSTKRLQKAGFVTKTVDEDNLRCKRLALTDKGREIIESHKEIFDEYDDLIFKSFSEEEKSQLFGYLQRLVSEMKHIEGISDFHYSTMELSVHLHNTMRDFIRNDQNNTENT